MSILDVLDEGTGGSWEHSRIPDGHQYTGVCDDVRWVVYRSKRIRRIPRSQKVHRIMETWVRCDERNFIKEMPGISEAIALVIREAAC